jgi:hypothetical protein
MRLTANDVAKLTRSHAGSCEIRPNPIPTAIDKTCPAMAFRGCDAGALDRQYRSVTSAPKGLLWGIADELSHKFRHFQKRGKQQSSSVCQDNDK